MGDFPEEVIRHTLHSTSEELLLGYYNEKVPSDCDWFGDFSVFIQLQAMTSQSDTHRYTHTQGHAYTHGHPYTEPKAVASGWVKRGTVDRLC